MVGDDAMADGHAQAGAFAILAAGEERLEQVLDRLGRHAAAVVLEFQHDGVEFIYMLSGKVIYRHADKLYPMSAGDALFFDAGAPHGPEELLERPMTYLSIIIYPRA